MLTIALRNVLRNKRRTVLTLLTMLGGFTLSAIAIGWQDGTYSRIIDLFTRNRLGHIQVHAKGYLDRPSLHNTIDNYDRAGKEIQAVRGVEAWAPRLFSAGLASAADQSAGVQVIGIDPAREEVATRFSRKITAGEPLPAHPSGKAVLGGGLARILNAGVGQELVIVSQGADGSIANDVYEVAGLMESGDEITDRTSLYLHLQDAQNLLFLENRVHEIAVVVDDINRVRRTADRITRQLNAPALSVSPWQVFAQSFYQAMEADRQGNWVFMFVIILIVAVGVLNTVLMSVLERRREYGVLKAIGTRPAGIFMLVIYEICMLAVAGVVFGAALSAAINHAVSVYGIPLPASFTYGGVEFTRLYAEVSVRSLLIPALTVLLSAFVVSVFPAVTAARIDPARAMRMH